MQIVNLVGNASPLLGTGITDDDDGYIVAQSVHIW